MEGGTPQNLEKTLREGPRQIKLNSQDWQPKQQRLFKQMNGTQQHTGPTTSPLHHSCSLNINFLPALGEHGKTKTPFPWQKL